MDIPMVWLQGRFMHGRAACKVAEHLSLDVCQVGWQRDSVRRKPSDWAMESMACQMLTLYPRCMLEQRFVVQRAKLPLHA